MTIARRYLYETADAVRLEALAGGTWAPLAELVGKIVREERYHRMHIEAWLDRLARADGEPRDRLLAALDDARAGCRRRSSRHSPASRPWSRRASWPRRWPSSRRAWRAAIEPTLRRLGLPCRPPIRDPARGRTDHGDGRSRWLRAEFTSVRRSDPGATW